MELDDTTLAHSYLGTVETSGATEFRAVTYQEALVTLLRARLAMHRGDWEYAGEQLRLVTGEHRPRFGSNNQLPHWILAEVEEQLGRLESAASIFAGITSADHSVGFDFWSIGLTYSFAHRRAALLYGGLGDQERAIEHWTAFLEAFTDPDPNFEWMVEEARDELARLGA